MNERTPGDRLAAVVGWVLNDEVYTAPEDDARRRRQRLALVNALKTFNEESAREADTSGRVTHQEVPR